MTKVCKICSADKAIQNEVLKLRREGQSHRNIEAALIDRYNFYISSTSIGRHLISCVPNKGEEKEEKIILQSADDPVPDNQQVHKELCNTLVNSIRFFNATLAEMTDAPANVEVHLNAVKALDVLINGFDKLYQNPKEGTGREQKKIVLSDLQLKVMKEVADLPESVEDQEVKEKVAEVFKNHDELFEKNKVD